MAGIPKRAKTFNVGGASILVVFSLLALSIFGALSVSSAHADLSLCDRAKSSVVEYYATDSKAQSIISKVDQAIISTPAGGSLQSYAEAIKTSVGELDTELMLAPEGNALKIAFVLPIGDSQNLYVSLVTTADSNRYKITEYRSESSYEGDYDNNFLDVWDGSFVVDESEMDEDFEDINDLSDNDNIDNENIVDETDNDTFDEWNPGTVDILDGEEIEIVE